jgi:phosphoglycerate dehydrogenase-like enzyme
MLVNPGDILAALDRPNGLLGAALNVTDPGPLPTRHALWTHPKCIVSLHLSGDAEGEFDLATDVLLDNARRLAKGRTPVNLVEHTPGY